MGQTLSRIRNLYAFEDGDHIDARMGVNIETGYGLTQYWDTNRNAVSNTDFTKHPATLYPFPYSSKRGQFVVPETQGQQWYYNNPDADNAGILDEAGKVKNTYKSLFEATTIIIGGVTYPALKIIGNLATAADLTDKHIYYRSTYNGKPFTCCEVIHVQSSVGDAKEILISLETEDGSGSNVLSNNNNWITMTATTLRAGASVTGGTYQWQKFVNGVWKNVTPQMGIIEVVASNKIKVYNAGVDSEDIFRVAVTFDGTTTYKTQQLTDTADVYYIYDGCSQAGDAVKAGVSVSFNPVVYDRRTNAVDTTNQWKFSFRTINMISGAEVGSKSTNVPFVVSSSLIDREKGITVIISATNE